MNRDRQQLLVHLGEQLGFLESSCRGFDEGNDNEALRIASVLRTLFHDTAKSRSLLVQLGYENELFMDSCSPLHPVEVEGDGKKLFVISGFPGPLAISPTKDGWRYLPLLAQQPNSPGLVLFPMWWETDILRDTEHYYTRHELVRVLTNKEGGAHIDPKLDAQYESMKSGSLGMRATAGDIEGFINSATRTTMRQLGWEVLESFRAIAPQ